MSPAARGALNAWLGVHPERAGVDLEQLVEAVEHAALESAVRRAARIVSDLEQRLYAAVRGHR